VIAKLRAAAGNRAFLLDVAPFIATLCLLWLKLSLFQVALYLIWGSRDPLSEPLETHFEVLGANVTCVLLLGLPLFLFPRVPQFILLLLLNFALTTLVVADTIHVGFYGETTSVWSVKAAVAQAGTILPSILALIKPAYGILFVDVVAGTLLLPAYARLSRTVPPAKRRGMVGSFAIASVVGALCAVPSVRLFAQERTGSFAFAYWQREVVASVGLLPYHVWDVRSFLVDYKRRNVAPQDVRRAGNYVDEYFRNQPHSPLFGVGAGRNVIMISAESIQSFLIGLHVNGQAIAPNLERLVKESLYFDNVHDQTHLGTTSDGEFLALNGLHPVPLGTVVFQYPDNDFRALPTILTEHGYSTMSAHGAPRDFWNMNKVHHNYGFQRSYFEDSYRVGERIGPWMADREFFDQTIPLLHAQAEPFFAFLISVTNHHPYALPARERVLHLGALEGTLLGDYLHTANYFDRALGQFVERLRTDGILDRTVLVIYGDHKGAIGAEPELPALLGYSADDRFHHLLVMKKIPLVIRLPHGEHAGARSVAGGHVDIAPTLLGLLGVDDPSRVMLGQDLTIGKPSLVVFRDGSFTDGEHYLVKGYGPLSSSTCYSVTSGSTVPCTDLQAGFNEAAVRLEISDLIVRGNLVSKLASHDHVSANAY